MRLKNKITVITGAGSGIGAAMARRFAAEGAFVYITDCDETASRAVREEIGTDRCVALTLDVTNEEACAALAEKVHAANGKLDVLVNNAGVGHVGTLLQTTGQDLDRLYAVNVRGMFNLTKAFLPHMLECKSGNIINTASIGGVVGILDRLAYCTTKFAVVGFTKCLALDHAAQGVRSNCLCPGRVFTPFVAQRLKEYPDPESAFQAMSATQPIGRMGTPQEIADAAVYLASDESSFVTGAAFIIDGGMSAG
jgi:NAD(P)-dependent dehydrogenase (short-subunit alcohol dehydrogenase family)